MKSELKTHTIRDLIEWSEDQLLKVDKEYQRGLDWTDKQKKLLIDSILRGYPIPLFYFHYTQKGRGKLASRTYWIVDGQQRTEAIAGFASNKFSLIDPRKDKGHGLPAFLLNQPCAWGGKSFSALDIEERERFLNTSVGVVEIETDDDDEVRDLFIRLQSGMPLTAQQKRDAWPGDLSKFIIEVAGKPGITEGHTFFRSLMDGRAAKGGAKLRQACAQMYMLFYYRRENGTGYFCDIDAKRVDNFYHFNISFDRDNPVWHADRFLKLLDIATMILGDGKRKKLKVHTAVHSLLLMDSLLDDFTEGWKRQFAPALDDFLHKLNVATRNMKKDPTAEYWAHYGAMARTDSSSKDVLEQRHHFFIDKMLQHMGPLQRKDPNRLFSQSEKELIYYSHLKNCAKCGMPVDWDEAEIHHAEMHSRGGSTTLDNGVLLHRVCHSVEHAEMRRAEAENLGRKSRDVPWEDNYKPTIMSEGIIQTKTERVKEVSLEYCCRSGIIESGSKLRCVGKGYSITAVFVAPNSITQGSTGLMKPANAQTLAQLASLSIDDVWNQWEVELSDGSWRTLELLRGLGISSHGSDNISKNNLEDNEEEDFEEDDED